ncbi:MAG: hypothetical protein V2B18_20605, partial [Pseudomonadota bacterium]
MAVSEEHGFRWEDGGEAGNDARHPQEKPQVPTQSPPSAVPQPSSPSAVGMGDSKRDAAMIMRSALAYLNGTFGPQWAERAAEHQRRTEEMGGRLTDLERDVSVANSQVKQRDKELKQLRGMVQELQTLKERLELERAELDKR